MKKVLLRELDAHHRTLPLAAVVGLHTCITDNENVVKYCKKLRTRMSVNAKATRSHDTRHEINSYQKGCMSGGKGGMSSTKNYKNNHKNNETMMTRCPSVSQEEDTS